MCVNMYVNIYTDFLMIQAVMCLIYIYRQIHKSITVGITRYKTRFSSTVKTINCVEEDRLASMKYSR
jgi:hypothetical protein